MIRNLLLCWLLTTCCSACAQVVQYPVRDAATAGRTYYKWVLDINHDGVNDALISLKETPDEVNENKAEQGQVFNPDYRGFGVYIGLENGGYVNSKYVTESGGDVAGGVGIDISQCYVGYVSEVKQCGIVTVETREVTAPSGKGLPVPKDQIYCYTVAGDHMKRTDLTPLLDDAQKSPIYKKYLSESRRTEVHLQEATP